VVYRLKGVKCIGRNSFLTVLCRIAGIPVNGSSDKRGLTATVSNTWPTLGWHSEALTWTHLEIGSDDLIGVDEDDFVDVERKKDIKKENFVSGWLGKTWSVRSCCKHCIKTITQLEITKPTTDFSNARLGKSFRNSSVSKNTQFSNSEALKESYRQQSHATTTPVLLARDFFHNAKCFTNLPPHSSLFFFLLT